MKEEDIKKQLNALGFKATKARLSIFNTFGKECHPLSADSIHKNLKKKDIDLVTVYRTLTSFEKVGLLRKVDLHKDTQFYELNNGHHHHIVCTQCGLLETLDACDLKDFSKRTLKGSLKFKSISQHSLEFFGLCKSCFKIKVI